MAILRQILFVACLLVVAGAGCSGEPGVVDCESLEFMCASLNEAECKQQIGCAVLKGGLWMGTELQSCLGQPEVFMTCRAVDSCETAFLAAQGCMYNMADPQQCYSARVVYPYIPDWDYAIGCEAPCGI